MLYLDTSLLVSLIAAEPSTGPAQAWLAQQSREQLAISDWVGTEVASALAAIQRNGGIDDRGRVRAAANLKALVTAAFTVLPVSRQAFRAAADMGGSSSCVCARATRCTSSSPRSTAQVWPPATPRRPRRPRRSECRHGWWRVL